MDEKPFYFENNSYKIFGILHRSSLQKHDKGFVFCCPFAEEKLWAQRVFVSFARELADRGYSVLRFDFMGHGDSYGNFEDSTVETRLSDIECAIETVKQEIPSTTKVGLLGLRFGATLAATVAEKIPSIHSLILWDPIVNGSKYMQELLRINLSTQSAVYKEIRFNREALVAMMQGGKTINIDGYEMSYDLYQQASSLNLLHEKKKFTGKCLIVQIHPRNQIYRKEFEKLSSLYENSDLIVSVEEPFWKEIKAFYSKAENLFENTLDWLDRDEK